MVVVKGLRERDGLPKENKYFVSIYTYQLKLIKWISQKKKKDLRSDK